MPLDRHMKDLVTYWAPTETRDSYGKRVFSTPVSIYGRWEDSQRIVAGKSGKEIISKSCFYTIQELSIDGYLYFGTSVEADPTTVSGAWEIQALGRSRNLRTAQGLTAAMM